MSFNIPLIDFGKCGLHLAGDDVTEQDFKDAGDELYPALSTIGFAYLTNHGVNWTIIDEMNEAVERFYALPLEEKLQFEKEGFVLSYDPLGRLKADKERIDQYEGFRTGGEAYTDDSVAWPDVSGLKESYSNFADVCSKLLMRLMKALGYGMKLKERDYFCQAHSLMNQKGNYSAARSQRYPPIPEGNTAIFERIGEHADMTTFTLLYQDNAGGLQVRDIHNNMVDVQPIPEAIVINIGETLATWSGKRLKATKHRVIVPADPEKRKLVRKSVAYFALGNDDLLMKKLVFDDDVVRDVADDVADGTLLTIKEFMIKSINEITTK